jgi:phosphohistidine phosphatase
MRLYFLRHTDALTGSHVKDAERPLSPKGIAEAEILGRIVASLRLGCTTLLSSPYVRARQTAEIVGKALTGLTPEICEYLKPESDPLELFADLRHFSCDSRLLLISHEPFVSTCLGTIICGQGEPKISIGKGALACVEVGGQVQKGAGILLWLLQHPQAKLLSEIPLAFAGKS